MMMTKREMFITDVKDGDTPDRIILVGQTFSPGDSIYEYFLSDEARAVKDQLKRAMKAQDQWSRSRYSKEFYALRDRDLRTALARFPDYEVRPPSFAGDISLYRK
jgi:hypothetical protein